MWVFGYGSLIWKTEFDFLYKKEAVLYKYERDFCIITEHHRGNKDFKGLVLGLVSNNNKHSISFLIMKFDVFILDLDEIGSSTEKRS